MSALGGVPISQALRRPRKPSKPRQPRVWRETQAAIEKALLPIAGVEAFTTNLDATRGMDLVFTVRVSAKDRSDLCRWFIAQQKYLARGRG